MDSSTFLVLEQVLETTVRLSCPGLVLLECGVGPGPAFDSKTSDILEGQDLGARRRE